MGRIYLSKKEKEKLLAIIHNHLDQALDQDEEEAESFEPDRPLVLKILEKVKTT